MKLNGLSQQDRRLMYQVAVMSTLNFRKKRKRPLVKFRIRKLRKKN